MKKRKLGKTGLQVSIIGLGGIPIQRCSQNTANQIIDVCVKKGVNFIDSARGYGNSEKLLGEALKGRRNEFHIATKSPAKTKQAMQTDIETSLVNFKTSYIDLYQCHYVKDMEQYKTITADGGAYEALVEAKQAGKIGHIGITAHSLDVITHAVATDLWETIQFPFNFVEVQALGLFKKASEKGLGILVMKPLAGGAIQDIELAFKFLVSNPHISTAIPGMDSPEQVIQNVCAANQTEKITHHDLKYIDDFRTKMGNNFCRRCGYCLPCTVGINIPFMFTLDGYVNRYHLKSWATERYQAQEVKASKCTQCGVCESRCPYDLKIRQRIEQVVATFGE